MYKSKSNHFFANTDTVTKLVLKPEGVSLCTLRNSFKKGSNSTTNSHETLNRRSMNTFVFFGVFFCPSVHLQVALKYRVTFETIRIHR